MTVKRVTQEQSYAMVRLRAEGLTIKKISELFSVSNQCVLDHTVPGHLDRRKKRMKAWYERQKAKKTWQTEEE